MPRKKTAKVIEKPEAPVSPELQDEHREGVVESAAATGDKQDIERKLMRMEMMRSLVTEPLLSQVQLSIKEGRPNDRYDVIISLNEMFTGGVPVRVAVSV